MVGSALLAGCNKTDSKTEAPANTPAAKVPAGAAAAFTVGQKAHCPVTGEEFVVGASTVQVEHQGKHYAFCCAECKPSFDKDPAKFAKAN